MLNWLFPVSRSCHVRGERPGGVKDRAKARPRSGAEGVLEDGPAGWPDDR
jgi:hypothetical protein